jgi:3-dehydroquinate dehydratase type I
MVISKPSICVAFPITSLATIDDTISMAQKAAKSGAKFIEFRLDYASDILAWSPDHYKLLIPRISVPIILTMRKREEGGKSDTTEEERQRIIYHCIDAHPAYVDIESSLDRDVMQEIYTYASENQVGLIYSFHDFYSTPSLAECTSIINTFKAIHPELEDENDQKLVLKVIFSAQTIEDNEVVLSICDLLNQSNKKFVCFCMGELGIYSRVKCLQHGSFFSFASFGSATAPGQIPLTDFESLYQNDPKIWQKYGFSAKILNKLDSDTI